MSAFVKLINKFSGNLIFTADNDYGHIIFECELLSKNVREKENRLLQLAYAPVRERVADALLQHVLPLRSPMNRSTVFNISREDLASIVGTTKESLVRMLSEFKREGIIRSEGREIVIMDEARLKRTAIGF